MQKVIVAIAFLAFAGAAILPAIDHRFRWSGVPTSIVIFGDLHIALWYLDFYYVFNENTYGAATIEAAENQ